MNARADALHVEHLRAARQVLGAWDLRVATVERVSVSENIAFRVVDGNGKPYVLRLHRPWYHTLDELISEQRWTRALLQAGVDVPVPVPTAAGAGYAAVDVAGERRQAGLLEWVEGETLGAMIERQVRNGPDAGVVDALCRHFATLGEIMAAIHNQATAWSPPPGFVRHAFDADGLLGEQPFWGRFWESPHLDARQRRRLESLRRPIHDALSAYGKARGTYSLIHADLHAGNVIVAGERLHVIDFDDAGFGWHQYDIAVALYNHRSHPRFNSLVSALLLGYRRRRPFSAAAARLLPLFLLIRSLASIGWSAARPEIQHGKERTAWLMRSIDESAAAALAGLSAAAPTAAVY